jgi:hypothetical protein
VLQRIATEKDEGGITERGDGKIVITVAIDIAQGRGIPGEISDLRVIDGLERFEDKWWQIRCPLRQVLGRGCARKRQGRGEEHYEEMVWLHGDVVLCWN